VMQKYGLLRSQTEESFVEKDSDDVMQRFVAASKAHKRSFKKSRCRKIGFTTSYSTRNETAACP